MKSSTTLTLISKYTKAFILFFSILIALSLFWNIGNVKKETQRLAEMEATTSLNKDLAFRLWGTRHGGAYLIVDEQTQPSVFLAHVSERDVKTTSGKTLTLYNPATMLREIMNDYSKLYGVKARITAELYLNPENAPDAWEAKALKELKRGKKEFKEITTIEGKDYLRVMQPMYMEGGCLKCHAWTGIKVGGLRGATDISISMEKYEALKQQSINKLIFTHTILWLIGIGSIFFLGRQLNKSEQKIKENQEHLRIVYKALEQSANGILVADQNGIIQYTNGGFERINGYMRDELVGQSLYKIKSNLNPSVLYDDMWSKISNGQTWRGELRNRKKDGSVYWCYETISPVIAPGGKITHYIGVVEDIENRKLAEEHIKQLMQYDALTNLPNRNYFREKLDAQLLNASVESRIFGLIFLDIDRFKMINDALGHLIGDILLQSLSERFIHESKNGLFISRLGGDEFAIITPLTDSKKIIENYIEKIKQIIRKPFFIQEHDIFVTASIGVTIYPQDGIDAEILIRSADMAMYGAKINGKNTHLFFEPVHGDFASEILEIESGLHKAIENSELFLVYQPKWDTKENRFIGLEVLVRWQSKTLGFMNPAKFIHIAEETDLIVILGEWILRESLVAMMRLSLVVGFVPKISVNLSPVQFKSEGLNAMVKDSLEKTNFPPEQLELEITEGALVNNPVASIEKMTDLCNYGVSFSIDDFGTGYSSMSYLKKFPVSTLKIDKSFVDDIIDDPHDRAIIQAIVTLAKSFNIDTIAEGAETREQVDALNSLGCYNIQGYWHSKPLEYTALLAYFEKIKE
ncbi:EAL domain-containing protein [Sulfurimonas sp.]|uniref:EAL domain-containing protein n=1 Tax=Sulfurimonas sp. TaxID=2022749 RepID=UPI0025D726D1|nr:EAL domain-containing protein [Sulfurimonas sp.]